MNIFDIYADVDTALWLQAETLGGSYTLRSVPSSPGRSTLTLKIINLDSLDSCSYLAHPVWISSWISSYHTIQGFVHTILLPYYSILATFLSHQSRQCPDNWTSPPAPRQIRLSCSLRHSLPLVKSHTLDQSDKHTRSQTIEIHHIYRLSVHSPRYT